MEPGSLPVRLSSWCPRRVEIDREVHLIDLDRDARGAGALDDVDTGASRARVTARNVRCDLTPLRVAASGVDEKLGLARAGHHDFAAHDVRVRSGERGNWRVDGDEAAVRR